MRNKTRKIIIGIGIFVLIAIFIYLLGGLNKTLAVFPSGIVGTTSVMNDGYQSVIFKLTASQNEGIGKNFADCSSSERSWTFNAWGEFDYLTEGTPATFNPSEVQRNDFAPSIVNIDGIQAETYPLNENSQPIYNVIFDVTDSKCHLEDRMVYCTFTVKGTTVGYTEACWYGTPHVEINVEILKNGVWCTYSQKSLCSEGQECMNNQCTDKQIYVYRLSNNQCSLISILTSQRTADDYDSLAECQANIIPSGGCQEGEKRYYTCPDGTEVIHCVCENNEFDCILSPESTCPEEGECVVDSDCEGKFHIAIPGSWDCVNGKCIWAESKEQETQTILLIIGIIILIFLSILIYSKTKRWEVK